MSSRPSMDQLQSKRPQRQVAAKPKTYVPFQSRKVQSTVTRNSPPNSKVRSASPASPASPASTAAAVPPSNVSDVETEESEADDVINMAPGANSDICQAPPTEHPPEAAAVEKEGNPITPSTLDEYFMNATKSFERMIRDAVDSFMDKLHQLEVNVEASLDFERKRVDDLIENQDGMKKKMKTMEKEIAELRLEVEKNKVASNKSERFSRRNNVRLVGVPEAPQGVREDPVTMVEEILHSKFKIATKVERAHRDGKKVDGRPRHILLKFLSYREKVDIMRRARETLKDETYFITDDLTPTDLEEKRKWIKQVQELYNKGTKLRFYSGKWRQAGGIPFNFE